MRRRLSSATKWPDVSPSKPISAKPRRGEMRSSGIERRRSGIRAPCIVNDDLACARWRMRPEGAVSKVKTQGNAERLVACLSEVMPFVMTLQLASKQW